VKQQDLRSIHNASVSIQAVCRQHIRQLKVQPNGNVIGTASGECIAVDVRG
jgi:hypothetical protein